MAILLLQSSVRYIPTHTESAHLQHVLRKGRDRFFTSLRFSITFTHHQYHCPILLNTLFLTSPQLAHSLTYYYHPDHYYYYPHHHVYYYYYYFCKNRHTHIDIIIAFVHSLSLSLPLPPSHSPFYFMLN